VSDGSGAGFNSHGSSPARSRGLANATNSRDSIETDARPKDLELRPAIRPGEQIFLEHAVAPGETLAAIGRNHGVTVAELMRLNGVTDPRRLQIGQKLRIPVAPATPPLPRPGRTAIESRAPDELSTADEPVSTFSLHVSDVSFRLAQAALARGQAPDPARIRPEEFYNTFDYGDPAPAPAEKIACRIEQAAHPVLPQRNLVRIAVRVPATGRSADQPLRLTVLLDTSGSMERADRAASVRRAMEVLGSLLGPNDRVTVIGFARTPRLLVEALAGDQAAAQLAALTARTPAEGGTNLEAALELALSKAQQYFHAPAQNRVVLLTDGAANLGNAEPERLATMITAARERGLAFDACGVGTNGLDDAILEALTRRGDGRYYVLDSPEDADAGFAQQLAGAFRPAARNVKLQVRFNPARVAHYRLIGFEQHRLREEDFRNDKVDAAELAAEEAAVAVYQVAVLPDGAGELGDVFVRFRDTATDAMVERSWTMPFEARARAFDQTTPTLQLAGVAALLAEKLRGGAMADLVRLDELAPVTNALRTRFAGNADVQQLVTMFDQARRVVRE
jgi:secreted protein with Ig-like and vWFA domain/LysM repeat protein